MVRRKDMENYSYAIKIKQEDVQSVVLSQRVNYKLVEEANTGAKNLGVGIVVVEPGGVCEPGDAHSDQEEAMFCLSGEGVIIVGDQGKEITIKPRDLVYIKPGTYHKIKNPNIQPLEVMWIISPGGWYFDRYPEARTKAIIGMYSKESQRQ
jgi:mannose-6-phosphate isomerase-like protein (cupin superfamily)